MWLHTELIWCQTQDWHLFVIFLQCWFKSPDATSHWRPEKNVCPHICSLCFSVCVHPTCWSQDRDFWAVSGDSLVCFPRLPLFRLEVKPGHFWCPQHSSVLEAKGCCSYHSCGWRHLKTFICNLLYSKLQMTAKVMASYNIVMDKGGNLRLFCKFGN